MDRSRVIALLSENAYVLAEDLALMELGFIQCHALGANATREHAARLKANLSRLQEVIKAFGGNAPCDPRGDAPSKPQADLCFSSSDGSAVVRLG